MVINTATAASLFNKAGYRLASKVTGQVIPNMPKDAASMTKCVVEHVSGKTKTIYSFLNAEGKAVQIQTLPNFSPRIKITDYTWNKPKTRTPDTAMYREKVDPYAFENYGVSYNTTIFDRKTRDVFVNSTTAVDIHAPSRTVTRSFASRTTPTGNAADGFTDKSRLTQIVNGKKTKEIYQSSTGTPDTVNTVTETKGFGVTQQELEQATSTPYFYAMFKNPIQMAKAAKTRAFANQGIPQTTNFRLIDTSDGMSWFSRKNDTVSLNVKNLRAGMARQCSISDLEHEARHKWQQMLVDKLDKGLLTNPEEIKMAQEFKHNFNNYIDKSKGYEAYETQPVEADAYKVTDAVYEKYTEAVDYLQKLFPRAARRTLGE